jgi:hypothetical protein
MEMSRWKIPAWHLLIYFIEYDDPLPMADTEEAKKGETGLKTGALHGPLCPLFF